MSDEKINTITFVDTETTGLDPERHEPWEIAAITYELVTDEPNGTMMGKHLSTIRAFVQPLYFEHADPVALKYNRYWDRIAEEGFEWDDAIETADALARVFKDTHIAGMNVPFDRDMINNFFSNTSFPPGGWHYHLIELETLMAGFLVRQGIRVPIPYKSDDLSRSLGVEPPPKGERHTAMADAEWCRNVFSMIWPVAYRPEPGPKETILPDWATEATPMEVDDTSFIGVRPVRDNPQA